MIVGISGAGFFIIMARGEGNRIADSREEKDDSDGGASEDGADGARWRRA